MATRLSITYATEAVATGNSFSCVRDAQLVVIIIMGS